LSLVFLRPENRIAGGIKTSHTAAILAFAAAMRIAGGTHLALLQRQAAGPVTGAALAGAFTVRTLSIGFRNHRTSFWLTKDLNRKSGVRIKKEVCNLASSSDRLTIFEFLEVI
jgi:hypothetical protein